MDNEGDLSDLAARFSLQSGEKQTDVMLELQRILRRHPKDRTPAQIQALSSFTSHCKFFSELALSEGTSAVQSCLQYLTLLVLSSGQVVFNSGEEGTKFYIVLSGSVAVLAPYRRKDGKKDYNQLSVLHPGDSFGELALLSNKPRSACILTRENSSFGVLERHDYLRILGKLHDARLSQKVDFLHQLPVFSSWTKTSLQKLSYYFKDRTYQWKQTLFRTGEQAEEVYIVKSGEFQLFKGVKVAVPRRFQLMKEAETVQHTAELTIVGVGEMLGAEELMRNSPFEFTCTCNSLEGEVYFMPKADFFAKVSSEDTATDALKLMNHIKHNYRSERFTRVAQLEAAKWTFKPAITPIPDLCSIVSKETTQGNNIKSAQNGLNEMVRKRWALGYRQVTVESEGKGGGLKIGSCAVSPREVRRGNRRTDTVLLKKPGFRHTSWLNLVRSKYFGSTGDLGVIFHQLDEPKPSIFPATRSHSSLSTRSRRTLSMPETKIAKNLQSDLPLS